MLPVQTVMWHLICLQAKRPEPSSVVDFEKIDQDARVG